MKKVISMLAMLVLVLTLMVAAGVPQASAATVDGVDYNYTIQDGNLYITYIQGYVTDLTIPSELDGMPVYGISDIGWNVRYNVETLTIPDSVQVLGESALQWMEYLRVVNIGAGLQNLYSSQFSGCDMLETINISADNPYMCAVDGVIYDKAVTTLKYCPATKTSITIPATVSNIDALLESETLPDMELKFAEDSAYFVTENGITYNADKTTIIKCSKDTAGEVTIPGTVQNFANGAFAGCDKITSLTIAEGVTNLVYYQFANCTSLKSVSVPTTLRSLSDGAFENCTALEQVQITDLAAWCTTDFVSNNSNPLYYANNLYLNGALVEELQIPQGVQSLSNYNFVNADCIQSVVLPEGLENMGWNVFDGCENLTSVQFPQSLQSISSEAFNGCTKLQNVTLPQNLNTIEYAAFQDSGLTAISFPESVTYIGGYAFAGTELTEVVVPGIEVGGHAFAYTPLEKVTLKHGMQAIAYGMFRNCTKLEKITLPESVTFIYADAFHGCTALKTVELPTDPVYFGEDCFYGCPLENLELSQATRTIDDYGLSGAQFAEITLPESVTCLAYRSFYNCDELQSITISKNVTEIYAAFVDCDSLTGIWVDEENEYYSSDDKGVLFDKNKVNLQQMPGAFQGAYTVPETVYRIDAYAFANCDSLTEITLPSKLRSMNGATFKDCDNLTNVVLAGSISGIGDSTFYNCKNLKSVTIPGSVEYIDWQAFYGCKNLTDIYFQGSASKWEEILMQTSQWGNEVLWTANVHFCGFDYVVQDGYAYITGAYFDDAVLEHLVIPETLNGYEVRGVTDMNWEAKEVMKSLTLPNTVTSLGWNVMTWSEVLETVNFGTGIVDIDQSLFFCCPSLKYVNVPEDHPTVVSIDGVIYDKAVTTMLACPEGRTTTITVPKTVTNIDCMPVGVNVVFEKGSTSFYTVDGLTYTADGTRLISCDRNKTGDVVIPDTVTSLQYASFYGCDKITSVTIPDSVAHLSYQFIGCTSLKSISLPDSIVSISMSSFKDCVSLERVDIPSLEGWLNIYFGWEEDNPLCYAGNLYVGGQLLTDLVIPETEVKHYAFYNADCLQSVSFHDNATLESSAFENCSNLKSVTLGNNLQTLPRCVFAGCESLESITLPSSLQTIRDDAFNGSGLKTLTVPATVTDPWYRAFAGCAQLTTVNWQTKATIPNECFAGCTSLTDVTLPDDTTQIGEYAFEGCPLDNFKLPSGMTYVSDYAFHSSAVKSFTLPETVTEIGYKSFYNCDSLQTITIPKTVTAMWGASFAGCDNLTAIEVDEENPNYSSQDGVLFNKNQTDLIQAPGGLVGTYNIPEGVTYSYGDAFYNCDKLFAINLPESMEDVGGFRECDNLRTMKLPAGMDYLAMHAFTNCRNLNSVQIPASVEFIGIYAFDGCTSLTDVFYEGTEEQWNQVVITEGNAELENATVHFQSQLPEHGNFNGDDEITDADAMYLLRHTLFGSRYKVIGNANVDGDGKITDADAMYLLRFTLFGADRYPLH